MNSPALEAFLAKLYVDPDVRTRFLNDPHAEAARAGLTEQQCQALETIDRIGLEMAARSFAHKRSLNRARQSSNLRRQRVRNILSRLNLSGWFRES
jgi:hypothetical protein